MPTRYPKLWAVAFLIVCVAWPFSSIVEAKSKKGRKSKAVSRSSGGSRKQLSSSRRSSKKLRQRARNQNRFSEDHVAVIPESSPELPDRIEVIEYGSDPPPDLARHLNPPQPRGHTPDISPESIPTVVPRRKKINIDSERTLQIQQALTERSFFTGEMTGVYDEATIDAMRRFQTSQKIPATGYPTAHALKRLGLTRW